ncbi:hypothetical protein [Methanosphaera sp.]|uniref:hypothetical protein n=1 Tax=Methanosphaera sp. TaxID=2666342 RepID=UPI0025E4FD2E|nr:hypothetical protein [Methanosphaera sp.]
MMNERLSQKERWEEREFIITSVIRMLAMIDFSKETVLDMYDVSKKLREVESVDAIVTDDTIFEWFSKGVK